MPIVPASQISRVRELELRYRPHRLERLHPDPRTIPSSVARFAGGILKDAATEVILVLHLNVKNRLVGLHRIPGFTECVPVSIPDVCRVALLSNASALIMVHNHLSGDPQPSGNDREFTPRLRNAVRLLGLELHDSIVVVDPSEGNQYYSFREQNLL